MIVQDPYAVLGVRRSASQADIRRAWLQLARCHHPDRGGDAAVMQAVNEAWAVLGDPARRLAWDREHGKPAPAWRARAHGAPTLGDEPDVAADEDLDLLDPRPLTPATSSRLDVLPVALFALAVVCGCLAFALGAPGLLAVAAVLFFFSCLAVAAVAMLAMRRGVRGARR